MDNLVIMMIVYNQMEFVKISLESIRAFADVNSLEVVVVDNGSTDGLRDWASGEEDITYVDMDEERELPFGMVINQVRKVLDICGDLLITNGSFTCTPNYLSRMLDTLHERQDIGVVGTSQEDLYLQEIKDYQSAVNYALKLESGVSKQTVNLETETILFKAEALEKLGPFDENLYSQRYVMIEYCLRMILSDWKVFTCESAFSWKLFPEVMRPEIKVKDEKMLEKKYGVHYITKYNVNVLATIEQGHGYEDRIDVLEIGCNIGATLLEIKNRFPNANVYGSEINEKVALVASHFATVVVDDITKCKLKFDSKQFDYIIFGDVLEHLMNPLEVLIYCKGLLKDDGCIIASIPNLLNISVMEQLLQGDFTYGEDGLLDKTHIHFFTYNEIIKIFLRSGYDDIQVSGNMSDTSYEQEELIKKLLALSPALEDHMLRVFQYMITARKIKEETHK